jgi:hypothetical protein
LLELPNRPTIEDGRELAGVDAVITTNSNAGPPVAQIALNVEQLSVKDFLEAQQGLRTTSGLIIQLRCYLVPPNRPKLLAGAWVVRRHANVPTHKADVDIDKLCRYAGSEDAIADTGREEKGTQSYFHLELCV